MKVLNLTELHSSDFLKALGKILTEASLAVAEIRESGHLEVRQKGEEGPLTRADLESNRICREGLSVLLPEAAWLSEETPDDRQRLQSEMVWIVDPIDGTRDFVEGRPEYSISIGLSVRGRAIVGGIALPAEGRILVGSRDSGLFSYRADGNLLESFHDKLNEKNRSLPGSAILVSRSEWKHGMYEDMKEDFSIDAQGSIARKLALLAAGETDLVVSRYPKNDWDICGGTALVEAAGGRVIRLDTRMERNFNEENPVSYGLVAGSPELVDAFLEYAKRKKIGWETRYH